MTAINDRDDKNSDRNDHLLTGGSVPTTMTLDNLVTTDSFHAHKIEEPADDAVALSQQFDGVEALSDDECSSDCDSETETEDAVATRGSAGLPPIGKIAIQNSTDVHIGNKTVYHGPVTIKQIVYPTANGKPAIGSGDEKAGGGEENPAFEDSGEGALKVELGGGEPRPTEVRKGYKWLQKLPHRRPVEIVIFLSVIVISLVILLVVLLLRHPVDSLGTNGHFKEEEGQSSLPIDYESDLKNNTLKGKVRIVSRAEWLAQPALATLNNLKTPVPYVIIHHTATENCSSQSTCVFHVRHIQMFHIESRGFDDIGYNFLVGGDGAAYEGRGWQHEGAHTYSWNTKSIGIAFVGTFMTIGPPQIQIDACKKIIALGLELGYIAKNYKLMAARQFSGTESPGIVLFKEMKTWDHFSETP